MHFRYISGSVIVQDRIFQEELSIHEEFDTVPGYVIQGRISYLCCLYWQSSKEDSRQINILCRVRGTSHCKQLLPQIKSCWSWVLLQRELWCIQAYSISALTCSHSQPQHLRKCHTWILPNQALPLSQAFGHTAGLGQSISSNKYPWRCSTRRWRWCSFKINQQPVWSIAFVEIAVGYFTLGGGLSWMTNVMS